MAIKERSQIKGTKAQIDAFAGHEGVLGFATDTKHLHVFSGTAGTSTEFLPKAEVDAKVSTETLNTELAKYVTSESLLDTNGKVKESLLPSQSFLPYQAYPIGSIYMNIASVDPATLLGGGTWERIAQGRFLMGSDASASNVGGTGGASTVALSIANMPSHNHGGATGTVGAGGNHSHTVNFQSSVEGSGGRSTVDGTAGVTHTTVSSGMPAHSHTISEQGSGTAFSVQNPYLIVCMWKRTA